MRSSLEALAARRPVFAIYDNRLKADYLKMTPFSKYISIHNNKNNLASMVQFYYSNKKIEQMQVEAGYDWVRGQTWDRVVDTYERLWSLKRTNK